MLLSAIAGASGRSKGGVVPGEPTSERPSAGVMSTTRDRHGTAPGNPVRRCQRMNDLFSCLTRTVKRPTSARRFAALLKDTPDAWLTRGIEMIDTPGRTLSGWRLLMMMLEHEVHHRSQIDTYAGLQGWPVPDIFGRSAESIDALQEAQRAKYATHPPA